MFLLKIKCKINLEYKTFLGKLFGLITKGPVERRPLKIKAIFTPMDEEARSKFNVTYGIQYYEINRHSWGSFVEIDLSQGEQPKEWETIPLGSGLSDFRIYITTTKQRDIEIFNKYEDRHYFTLDHKIGDIPTKTKYYSEPIKIYSLSDVLLIIIAIVSGIGAIAEILNLLLN